MLTTCQKSCLYLQAFHNPSILQVFCNYLVDILLIYIGIPDRFRVNSDHRTLCTTVQATGRINPHPALAGKPQFLAALLGIIPQPLSTKTLTAITAVRPQICTKKDMVLVIGHG